MSPKLPAATTVRNELSRNSCESRSRHWSAPRAPGQRPDDGNERSTKVRNSEQRNNSLQYQSAPLLKGKYESKQGGTDAHGMHAYLVVAPQALQGVITHHGQEQRTASAHANVGFSMRVNVWRGEVALVAVSDQNDL